MYICICALLRTKLPKSIHGYRYHLLLEGGGGGGGVLLSIDVSVFIIAIRTSHLIKDLHWFLFV